MSRPQDKTQLLTLSQAVYDRLVQQVQELPEAKRQQPFPDMYMNRNVRDVLAHLHHWHLLFLDWYREGMAGRKPVMPSEGYTWKTVPDLNRAIRDQYSHFSLDEILALLHDSYRSVQLIIMKHSNDELFEKKHYSWTGSTSLGSYLVSASSSHYEWAVKLIKKALK